MANVTWDQSTASKRRKRFRAGNRWLVAGTSNQLSTGDTFFTWMRELNALSFTGIGFTAAGYAVFLPSAGTFISVHGAGAGALLDVIAICR